MSAVSARSVSHTLGVDRVRALQRVLYRCAKQDRDRRFHAVYDKVARSDVLWKAWGEVRANRGAPGVDGIAIGDVVASGVGEFLDELAKQLRAGTYRPRPLRRVYIPKPGRPGQVRPLGIPCVADRVVMAAAKAVLEPIFEADFLPSSYGFRPGLSAHHALETVRTTVNRGKVWVLDADIRSCFDEIDSHALVVQIERRVCDRRMLKLIRGWLRAGVFEGGIVSAIEAGTPQGSPMTAPTQVRTSSSSGRFRGRREGVGREAWYSSGLMATPSSLRRRVRGSRESRGRVAGRAVAGGLGARAAGRAWAVGAPSASVCERGAGSAGGRGRARADGGVHGPVGAVVDRWAARAGGSERPDAERGDGGGGQRVSRSRPRATRWQGALRSSSWVTGSPARGSRRRTRSWRPSGAV